MSRASNPVTLSSMRLLPLMLLSLAACPGAGPGTFTGTVQGNGLEVKGAALVANTEVWLSNVNDLCPKLKRNQFPKNGSIVKLVLKPVAAGEFNVVSSLSTAMQNVATLQFIKLNDTCGNALVFAESIGTSGKVTVNGYEADQQIDGNFEATFGSSDAVTGSFNAQYCDAPTLYPSPECVDVE